MRMEMLSDDEEKVVDALRLVANAQSQIQKTAAQEDMRRELEEVYRWLSEYDDAYDPRALVEECARRVHNLLY